MSWYLWHHDVMIFTASWCHDTHGVMTSWYSRHHDVMILIASWRHDTHGIMMSWYSWQHDVMILMAAWCHDTHGIMTPWCSWHHDAMILMVSVSHCFCQSALAVCDTWCCVQESSERALRIQQLEDEVTSLRHNLEDRDQVRLTLRQRHVF